MKSYISKHEIREINRKLAGYDIVYNDEDESGTLELIIANIIQGYNPKDEVSSVPTVLEIRKKSFNNETLEKLQLLDPKSVIIQVNNALLDSQDKATFLKQLKDLGYKLMIELNKDDEYFNYAKMIADIIKIDIKNISGSVLGQHEFLCKKLAYNVDTAEDYVLAEAASIDYYEGKYISASIDMDIRQNGHSKVNFLEVIKLVREKADLDKISRVISRDPLLSAQVIRLCNSSNKQVTTVKEATEKIGIKRLERWIYLLQFSKSSAIPEELIKESYNRAELCRLLVKEYKLKGITENKAYMIGLFSELDILAGRSMSTELVSLNLDTVVENALIYRDGIGGELLNLVIAYEEANWERVDVYAKKLKISKDKIFKLYFESVTAIARIWDELEKYGGKNN